jgi:hypothetical protein
MQNAGANVQQANSLDMAKGLLEQIAVLIKQAADVVLPERPALIQHFKIMGQAGSAIANEIQAGSQQAAPQQQMPTPQDTAGMVSMS